MITIIAEFYPKKDRKNDFLTLINEIIEKSRAEEGCKGYTLFLNKEDEQGYTLIEKWVDQKAIDIHNETEHFTAIVPKLVEINEGDVVVKLYEEV